MEPDFAPTMVYKKRGGWQGVTEEGETLPAELLASLLKPLVQKKNPSPRRAWSEILEDGCARHAPSNKLPKEKEIIRPNLSRRRPIHHRHRLRP